MFVDASAVVAIIAEEEGYETFQARLEKYRGPVYISALTRFEAIQAIARKSSGRFKPNSSQLSDAGKIVDRMVSGLNAQHVDISEEIGILAVRASATYGKAVGHPADLNMGDCFAYACAKSLNVPLLYKGEDFAQTDLA